MRMSALVTIGGAAALLATACGSSSSSSGSAGGGGGGGDYCTAAKAVRDVQGQVNVLGTATAVADEKSAIAAIAQKVDAAAASAPSDVAADWATIKAFFDLVNGAVQTATDTDQAQSDVNALASNSVASSASAALDAAGKRIDTYTQAHCGFAISTPTPGDTGTSTQSSTESSSASST